MKQEKLIYIINRKKYILVQGGYTSSKVAEKEQDKIIEFGGICLGVEELKTARFWQKGYMILKYLIPLNKIWEFQNNER